MSDNIPSSATLLSHVMSWNQIVELHLFRCDSQISFNLPMVTHLTLIDSLNALNTCFTGDDWIALHILSTLPLLNSSRVLLYDMRNPTNDTSSEIIATTALKVIDFDFCFRRR
ncbi:unnamed protein product [Rotaria sp. Silwood2]|nr:unnamed protein product [Rotaria sp. Silwood2]CAF3995098.1 unnamed protein product [Rotaria sp. Silwood2]CAF4145444.1 unnamed protein product [Rotaria sp. Silwood2]CAF4263254.1 unnamed protein product [Rotaria sp. Silwood2]